MRRLNVREAQIDECIQKSMFAFSFRPQNPELQQGELLLLQLEGVWKITQQTILTCADAAFLRVYGRSWSVGGARKRNIR